MRKSNKDGCISLLMQYYDYRLENPFSSDNIVLTGVHCTVYSAHKTQTTLGNIIRGGMKPHRNLPRPSTVPWNANTINMAKINIKRIFMFHAKR